MPGMLKQSPRRWTRQDKTRHTQRSPTSIERSPGLTGKSVGVMTPRKRILLCWCSLAKCALHQVLRWTQSTGKRRQRPHRLLLCWILKILYHRILGFGATATQKQEARREDRPGEPGKTTTPGEDSYPNFFLWYENFVHNDIIFVENPPP